MKFETIRQTELISATPNEVYDAYLYPHKHSKFTGSPASGSPSVGGKFTAWDGYIEGKFIELKRGQRIVHEWKTSEWPQGYPNSIVELTFRSKGKKTELEMVHSKVPSHQAESYAEGWREHYWEPLKRYFRDSSQ